MQQQLAPLLVRYVQLGRVLEVAYRVAPHAYALSRLLLPLDLHHIAEFSYNLRYLLLLLLTSVLIFDDQKELGLADGGRQLTIHRRTHESLENLGRLVLIGVCLVWHHELLDPLTLRFFLEVPLGARDYVPGGRPLREQVPQVAAGGAGAPKARASLRPSARGEVLLGRLHVAVVGLLPLEEEDFIGEVRVLAAQVPLEGGRAPV